MNLQNSDIAELMRQALQGDSFAFDLTGITLDELSLDRSSCSLCLTAKHLNARGMVMGGVLFTIADIAAAALANAGYVAAGKEPSWVTLSANISFLKPAMGHKLTAVSSFVRQGRGVAVVSTDVVDDKSGLVARITSTAYNTGC